MIATPPPPATRLGIAIDLDQLRQLMREFIVEQSALALLDEHYEGENR
jgi:hypothetical protein